MRLLGAALLSVMLVAGPAGAGLPTVLHEGRPYVELHQLARAMSARVEATPDASQARLRSPRHTVTFTRNRARVVVDGRAVVLDAPVRVRNGVWLVPEAFVDRVLPPRDAAMPAALPKAAVRVSLEDLRLRSYPAFTRVVLETSAPVGHRVENGGAREVRVRVVGLAAAPRTEDVKDGLIEQVRVERAGEDTLLRVVFEAGAVEPRVITLTDPDRLVLDFQRPAAAADRPGPLRTIVLDAGHGGHDTGAIGPTGLMEKDLVLDVTRRVARLAERELGVRVLLTRDGDTFVPLRDRTSFANRERADLFISIHANAHRHNASEGVETYFLSSEATDSEARQVAALENSVVQLEKPGDGGRGRTDIVRAILWDLAQSEFQVESSRLAEIVQDSMTRALRIPNRGVKQAGFYVLGGAAMPAILIEIGFVSNPREERRLRDGRYREEIARAILTGLAEYKRYWDQRVRAAAERPR
ncbi:MAG TPA: N-acetylmuramoyl-L-alanine amidase [Calidithermus sp.]|nr:N-acetylmuramoyl-L-alanine amidase [Calidithermus sp.]